MPRFSRHTLPALLLLALGAAGCVVMWGAFAQPHRGTPVMAQVVLAAAAVGLCLVPGVGPRISRGLERLRRPSDSARRRVTLAVWAAASLYLAATAYFHARDLYPRIHDECSYTIQARMLAQGRLWTPPHALADFFESFHILVRPVYGSIYFPGTALMNVPGVWLGLPAWVVPVLLAGGVVALAYRVTAELVDGVAGLLAALLVVAAPFFRTFSTMVMAQVPSALLGLLIVWAWLRWRRARSASSPSARGWAAAVGAAAGWAAITRPVDALAFALPVGVAMTWDLFRSRGAQPVARDAVVTAALVCAAAAPFLLLQVAFNVGVTGRPLKTPYVLYLELNQPGSVFGVGGAAAAGGAGAPARPGSQLPQKQIYFDELVAQESFFRGHGWAKWLGHRLRQAALSTLASPLLVLLIPLSLLAAGRRRWVVLVVAPLFAGLYLLNPFYLNHYSLPLVPVLAFAAVLGVRVLQPAPPGDQGEPAPERAAPIEVRNQGKAAGRRKSAKGEAAAPGRPRFAGFASSAGTLAVALVALVALPELNPAPRGDAAYARDELFHTPLLNVVEQSLAGVRTPAVVLFRYHPSSNVHEEPVYNYTAARPDDAAVVRAHDLGPSRNVEIFRYYGEGATPRTFYLFDRSDASLTELGPAGVAADRLREIDAAKRK